MSFRTRLTSFFIRIVVVPMVAIGFLGSRLISDSENGKADARAGGLASAAASLYQSGIASARADARMVARDPVLLSAATRHSRLSAVAARAGLARATVTTDHGPRNARRHRRQHRRRAGGGDRHASPPKTTDDHGLGDHCGRVRAPSARTGSHWCSHRVAGRSTRRSPGLADAHSPAEAPSS
jgi:hypothetical protein